jgi:imidazole glycerol-phosphate synthase subunit HisF
VLTKRIIPCLDVKDGRVVKGVNFVGLQDVGDPVTIAEYYNDEGADELVFLDIAATHEGRKTMVHLVERIAEQVFIPLTVGGGISSLEEMHALLRAGADKISINSSAVKNPQLIRQGADTFGTQCIVVAVDAKRHGDTWHVYVNGGRVDTRIDVLAWVKEVERCGAGEILLTSMDADGTKNGYDIELLECVAQAVRIPVIASGGCGSIRHIVEVLQKTTVDAALAASIFHYGEASIQETKRVLAEQGVVVRI